MDTVGVIGLVVGLWLVIPGGRTVGRDVRVTALGWVLTAFASLLILTSSLTVPATRTGSNDAPSTDAPALPKPNYPLTHPITPANPGIS
jgi:hypothetical protein